MSETAVAASRPSPRTAQLPMAFTVREFFRGAFAALGYFLALFAPVFFLHYLAFASLGAISPYLPPTNPFELLLPSVVMTLLAYPWALPWSLAGFLVGAPLAFGLGMALRRIANRKIHLLAFALLGLLVGIAATVAATGLGFGSWAMAPFPVSEIYVYSPLASFSVVLGWGFSAGRALKADRVMTSTIEIAEPTVAQEQLP